MTAEEKRCFHPSRRLLPSLKRLVVEGRQRAKSSDSDSELGLGDAYVMVSKMNGSGRCKKAGRYSASTYICSHLSRYHLSQLLPVRYKLLQFTA
eukprot:scaffold39754_cov150-Skeletonema_dohrnii-CCMP3373.AAC.1